MTEAKPHLAGPAFKRAGLVIAALTEATLLTTMSPRRYALERDPRHEVQPEALPTVRPRGDLPTRLHPR
jgi:hypothetical protein